MIQSSARPYVGPGCPLRSAKIVVLVVVVGLASACGERRAVGPRPAIVASSPLGPRAPACVETTGREAASLLAEGRTAHSLRVLDAADASCPEGSRTTRALRLRALVELDLRDQARALCDAIDADPHADDLLRRAVSDVRRALATPPATTDPVALVHEGIALLERDAPEARRRIHRGISRLEKREGSRLALRLRRREQVVAWLADGRFVVSGEDGAAIVAVPASERVELPGRASYALGTPDGARVVLFDEDTVRVADTRTGVATCEAQAQFVPVARNVRDVLRMSSDGALVLFGDGRQRPVALEVATCKLRRPDAAGWAELRDGIAFVHGERTIVRWNARTGESNEFTLPPRIDRARAAEVGGTFAAFEPLQGPATSSQGCVLLLDERGRVRARLTCAAVDFAFHPRKPLLVITTESGAVHVHDARTGRLLHVWPAVPIGPDPANPFTAPFVSFESRGDSAFLHATSIGVWLDVESGRPYRGMVDDPDVEVDNIGIRAKRSGKILDDSLGAFIHLSAVWNDVRWSEGVEARGDRFLYGAQLWALSTGRMLFEFGPGSAADSMEWTSAGLVVHDHRGEVREYSEAGVVLRHEEPTRPPDRLNRIPIPGSTDVLTMPDRALLRVGRDGATRWRFDHSEQYIAPVVSPSGRLIAVPSSGNPTHGATLLDAANGRARPIGEPALRGALAVFSPDERTLALRGAESTVFFDVATGKRRGELLDAAGVAAAVFRGGGDEVELLGDAHRLMLVCGVGNVRLPPAACEERLALPGVARLSVPRR